MAIADGEMGWPTPAATGCMRGPPTGPRFRGVQPAQVRDFGCSPHLGVLSPQLEWSGFSGGPSPRCGPHLGVLPPQLECSGFRWGPSPRCGPHLGVLPPQMGPRFRGVQPAQVRNDGCSPHLGVLPPQSTNDRFRNSRSAIHNPQFAIRNSQSAIHNPQSAIHNPPFTRTSPDRAGRAGIAPILSWSDCGWRWRKPGFPTPDRAAPTLRQRC